MAFNTIKPQSAISGICGLWQSDTINTTTPYRGVVLWYARRTGVMADYVFHSCFKPPREYFGSAAQRTPRIRKRDREYLLPFTYAMPLPKPRKMPGERF